MLDSYYFYSYNKTVINQNRQSLYPLRRDFVIFGEFAHRLVIAKREGGEELNRPLVYALLLFAVVGTVIQWAWIWHFINRVISMERDLAVLSEQVSADHAKDAEADTTPEI